MRSHGARAAARAASKIRRFAKQLRDGTAAPDELAERIIEERDKVSPKTMSAATRSLGIEAWTRTLLVGDRMSIARLSPAWRARVETPRTSAIEADAPSLFSQVQQRTPRSAEPERIAKKAWTAIVRQIKYMTTEQILAIHFALVEEFADGEDPIFPPGVKNENLLESAVSRQFTSMGGEPKYKTVNEVAATLMYGLAMNHPFHNGNKRTALVSMIVQMDLNGLAVTATEEELFDFILGVAEHALRPIADQSSADAADKEVAAIAAWLRTNSRRKEHVDPSITWRELKKLLAAHGSTFGPPDRSQLEITRGRLRSVVDFDGDSREVARGVIRKVRADLGLTEADGYDADVFYGYSLPLDAFITKHRTVLRRLANA